jgi:hypothetical protein
MHWLERFWFGCGGCQGHTSCPVAEAAENGRLGTAPLGRGSGLVLACLTVFVLPLATGIGGAWLVGRWGGDGSVFAVGIRQVIGLVTGLAMGVATARWLVAQLGRRRAKDSGGTV